MGVINPLTLLPRPTWPSSPGFGRGAGNREVDSAGVRVVGGVDSDFAVREAMLGPRATIVR
jgi:hypothetical protein